MANTEIKITLKDTWEKNRCFCTEVEHEQVWFLEFKLLVSQQEKMVTELLHSMFEVLGSITPSTAKKKQKYFSKFPSSFGLGYSLVKKHLSSMCKPQNGVGECYR